MPNLPAFEIVELSEIIEIFALEVTNRFKNDLFPFPKD
jgi:hypothetical protein